MFFLFCLFFPIQVVFADVPMTKLTDIEGKPALLSQAKPWHLVVFWATWCHDCREKLTHELPEMDLSPVLSVTTVNLDSTADRARAYLLRAKVTLPVLRDPSSEFRKDLGVYSVPHWVLYRRKGAQGPLEKVASEGGFNREKIMKWVAGF